MTSYYLYYTIPHCFYFDQLYTKNTSLNIFLKNVNNNQNSMMISTVDISNNIIYTLNLLLISLEINFEIGAFIKSEKRITKTLIQLECDKVKAR